MPRQHQATARNESKKKSRRKSRHYYYDNKIRRQYGASGCSSCGSTDSADLLKPVLLTFLIPLAIGFGLGLLWLLSESAKIGVIAFLQQQQQQVIAIIQSQFHGIMRIFFPVKLTARGTAGLEQQQQHKCE